MTSSKDRSRPSSANSPKRRAEREHEKEKKQLGKIRHVIEALISAFLFIFQHVPISIAGTIGPMLMPLFLFVFTLHSSDPRFWSEVNAFLFSREYMFGRIVAISGLIIFLAACVQLAYVQLLRKDELVTYGLYSVVRHPQYFGIIVVTLGITIMCIQSTYGGPSVTEIWLVQVLGYILLAGYEERHLMKEHEEEYQQYREKVASIFPIPHVPKIPETLVSLAVAVLLWYLLVFLNT